jgi:hypothetical protein
MRLLTWKALQALLAFDLFGLNDNFAKMHKFVTSRTVSGYIPPPNAVNRVCDAVNNACVWYPKRVLCLQRSTVTTCMLRRYGIPAQMVIGAQKVPFKAHAWTEVDGRPINERREVHKIYDVWERC